MVGSVRVLGVDIVWDYFIFGWCLLALHRTDPQVFVLHALLL